MKAPPATSCIGICIAPTLVDALCELMDDVSASRPGMAAVLLEHVREMLSDA